MWEIRANITFAADHVQQTRAYSLVVTNRQRKDTEKQMKREGTE